MRAMDVSDPSAPQVVGAFDADGPTEEIAVSGSHAYVIGEKSGLRVLDLAHPARPQPVGAFEVGKPTVAVWAASDRAYAAVLLDGVCVADVSETSRPRKVGPPRRISRRRRAACTSPPGPAGCRSRSAAGAFVPSRSPRQNVESPPKRDLALYGLYRCARSRDDPCPCFRARQQGGGGRRTPGRRVRLTTEASGTARHSARGWCSPRTGPTRSVVSAARRGAPSKPVRCNRRWARGSVPRGFPTTTTRRWRFCDGARSPRATDLSTKKRCAKVLASGSGGSPRI